MLVINLIFLLKSAGSTITMVAQRRGVLMHRKATVRHPMNGPYQATGCPVYGVEAHHESIATLGVLECSVVVLVVGDR